jgi:uncharacterized repeat protein (TIGR03803 family)
MPGASVMTIASFPTSAGDGTDPDGQLFMDSNGDLLGATVHGGSDPNPANQIGTTYEITKVAGGFATTPTFLADIPTGLNTLVGVPNLSADANGDLFGLEITGGTNSLGAVVEFPAGGGSPITLATTFPGGAGGSHPGGRLLLDASGDLFGTTLSGGANGSGTVFEIKKTGNSYATTPTVLASFGSGVTPNGAGNLVEDAAGDLFGTTTSAVFEVQKTGSSYAAPVLISFPAGTQIGSSLTIDAEGDIFGTTISGGANGDGTVFEIVKNTDTPITLASFSLVDGELTLNHPTTLIVDSDGDLFGTTDPSSQNSVGVVFEIVNTGGGYSSTPTIVENLNGSADTGLGANLVADASGDLFGTTQTGGVNGSGTVFEITNAGFVVAPALTAGASIDYVAGAAPVALDPGLSISDPESPTLVGATVSISSGFVAGDTLSVGSPQASITSSYNAGTGVLTLSSASGASLAAYQAELDSVAFASPSTASSSPTITWSVNDGIATSTPVTSNVSVFANNSGLDILLQSTSGQLALWQASGVTLSASGLLNPNPGPSWTEMGVGAFFSGDTSDILWQNTDGTVAVWQMQNDAFVSGDVVADPGPSWRIEGTGDFNGNGRTDILLQNQDGDVAVWEMNNGQISQGAEVADPGPSWNVVGAADFNGDGKSDILLQSDSGQLAIWNMNGDQKSSSTVVNANPGPAWHAVGTGDFYGDGQTDILFQNNDGDVAVWEMNGEQQNASKSAEVADPGPAWQVVGTGDFNSDGKTDIVLQNTNGSIAVWDMNGSTIGQSAVLANPGTTWSVVAGTHLA